MLGKSQSAKASGVKSLAESRRGVHYLGVSRGDVVPGGGLVPWVINHLGEVPVFTRPGRSNLRW
jgi:hypothetical protein